MSILWRLLSWVFIPSAPFLCGGQCSGPNITFHLIPPFFVILQQVNDATLMLDIDTSCYSFCCVFWNGMNMHLIRAKLHKWQLLTTSFIVFKSTSDNNVNPTIVLHVIYPDMTLLLCQVMTHICCTVFNVHTFPWLHFTRSTGRTVNL